MNRFTIASLTAALLSLAVSTTPTAAQSAQTLPSQRALQWLQCSEQQPNGQIGPNTGNPIARSSEVVVGLAAAGQDAAGFKHNGASLATYLKTASATDVGTSGELLLARAIEPSTGLAAPVIAQLKLAKSAQGEYGTDVFSDALAIIGLRAAQQPVGDDAVAFLRNKQNPSDHGWSFDNAAQYGSDSNTTALVMQAMVAAGVSQDDPAIANGFVFLSSLFQGSGFSYQSGLSPDAQSDELVVGSIVAAGRQSAEGWSSKLSAAENHLAGLQIASGQPDAGAEQAFDKLMATTPAPAAFLLRPLTARSVATTVTPLLACPVAASSPPQLAPTGGGPAPLLLAIAVLSWILAFLVWRPRRRAHPG